MVARNYVLYVGARFGLKRRNQRDYSSDLHPRQKIAITEVNLLYCQKNINGTETLYKHLHNESIQFPGAN